jgi:hypothetical protein
MYCIAAGLDLLYVGNTDVLSLKAETTAVAADIRTTHAHYSCFSLHSEL